MSSRFVRKLRRELTANPKKAGILGVMLLVALWFWAPLLKDWFGGPAGSTAGSPSDSITVPTTASTEASKVEAAMTPKLNWRELATRLEADPLMRPHDEEVSRDPFHAVAAIETEPAAVEPAAVKQVVITPDEAGLSLTSTLVGSKRQVARVLGKSYQIGDRIKGTTKDEKQVEFIVAEIHPRRIVLERAGQQFNLEIPVGGHELLPSRPEQSTTSATAEVSGETN